MNNERWEYLRKGKKKVHGWLQRIDAEIFGAILDHQDERQINGSCVEVGVHHGKSFIPLCMAVRPHEAALCIDIFDDQSRNLDASGRGDWQSFHANLVSFGIDPARVNVIKRSSDEVDADFIRQHTGPVRFFSIDGGHWRTIVRNDLELAESLLSEQGVIALDDYYRAEWPDVTTAYVLWQEATSSDIVPFAIGSNKLYLCRKQLALEYREALRTPFLNRYFSKSYRAGDTDIDCYRVELVKQDEESVSGALRLALKIFRPDKVSKR